MKQQYKGNLLLLLTAIIWGSALVAQSVSMDLVGPFTFQCMRSILGTLALLPVAAVFRDKQNPRLRTPAGRRDQRVCGLICGVSFFVAGSFQQIGLCYTSPGKAGFITALYIVLVPLAGIFFGKRAGWHVWAGVLLALAGLAAVLSLCVGPVTVSLFARDNLSRYIIGYVRLPRTLACLLFMKRMADVAVVKEWEYVEDTGDDQGRMKPVPAHVMVYEITGPMFFGAADKIPHIGDKGPRRVLILRMRAVPALDITALNGLRRLWEECERNGIQVIFSHVNEQPLSVFRRSGLYDQAGAENFVPNIDAALERAAELASGAEVGA